jgi:LPS O-antigen subunit length determinant protein (WzzB/FepE family)
MVCTLLAFTVSSFIPKIYYTEIRLKIDDPISNKMPSMLSADMGKNISSFFGNSTKNESEELFLELLCGRDNLVLTINEFSLDTLYKTKYMEATIKSFNKRLNIDIQTNNIIFCGFKDKNRDLATAVVRFMVTNANNRFISLQKERLAMNTAFLTKRNQQLMDSLELNSRELITFYRDNNVINIEDQIELTMLTLARYEEQINLNTVNEIISKGVTGSSTPISQEIKVRSQILKQEFQKIRGVYDDDYKPSKQSVLINTDWGLDKMLFEQIAKAKIEFIKDFLVILSKELALSEAQLSKNIPAIQIIQDAYYPDWKIAPKRIVWMALAFIIALLLTISFITLSAFINGELEGSSEIGRQKLVKLLGAIWE